MGFPDLGLLSMHEVVALLATIVTPLFSHQESSPVGWASVSLISSLTWVSKVNIFLDQFAIRKDADTIKAAVAATAYKAVFSWRRCARTVSSMSTSLAVGRYASSDSATDKMGMDRLARNSVSGVRIPSHTAAFQPSPRSPHQLPTTRWCYPTSH